MSCDATHNRNGNNNNKQKKESNTRIFKVMNAYDKKSITSDCFSYELFLFRYFRKLSSKSDTSGVLPDETGNRASFFPSLISTLELLITCTCDWVEEWIYHPAILIPY